MQSQNTIGPQGNIGPTGTLQAQYQDPKKTKNTISTNSIISSIVLFLILASITTFFILRNYKINSNNHQIIT